MSREEKRVQRILFVCHGNICRSPMAEFVLRDMAEKRGIRDRLIVASAATSAEELGNPVHPGTRRLLAGLGISTAGKTAVQLTRADYERWDWLLGMDSRNLRNMQRILGGDPAGKVRLLLDFTAHSRDIADPWYTGDLDATSADVREGCAALLDRLF